MTFVYYSIIPILAILITGHFILKYHKKQKIEARKKHVKETMVNAKASYKQVIKKMLKLGLLDEKVANKYLSIMNNYFVFRTLNDENLEKFAELAKQLTHMMNSYTQKQNLVGNEVEIHKQILALSTKIPVENRSFNTRFYDVRLPQLITEYSIETLLDSVINNKNSIQKLIATQIKKTAIAA